MLAAVMAIVATLAGGMPVPALAEAAAPIQPEPRVVGGKVVDATTFATQWPFIVGVRFTAGGRTYRCGGSLATDEVVVTAAHCLHDRGQRAAPEAISVIGSTTDLGAPGFTAAVRDVAVHPGYDPVAGPVGGDDLALLRLTAAVPAPSVPLAAPGEVPQSGTGLVAGYGVNDQSTRALDTLLRQAALPVQPADYCNIGIPPDPGYGPGAVDPAVQVCAGQFEQTFGPVADTCLGDSGGPLVVRDALGTRLVGVTSYGSTCGRYPGVYAAIGGYRGFLDAVVDAWDPGAPPPPDPGDGAGTFVPLAPVRLVDTRGEGLRVVPGEPLVVPMAAAAPSADAVALNLTATEPEADGYLTAYPCGGPPPLASNLNYARGDSVAAGVVVGLGDGGAVCIATYAPTDVVVDLGGYVLAPGVGAPAAPYHPLAPVRLADTRGSEPLRAGEIVAIAMSDLAPELVGAVTATLTVVEPDEAGYLTAFPCGPTPPHVSNVNYAAGDVVANAVAVAVDTDERLCLTASADTDVVLDATGWFGVAGAPGGGRLTPVAPQRLIDTRGGPIPAAGSVVTVPVAVGDSVPPGATAVVVAVTAVDPAAPGYLSAYPCGQAATTSTVNHVRGGDVANLAFVPLGEGDAICVFTYAASHVVVDLAAYVAPG